MKTPAEIVESSSLSSPEEFKRRASTTKRVAGGLRSELAAAQVAGLSKQEAKAVTDALAVLDRLAGTYKQAEKLSAKRREDKEKAQQAMRTAMASTFGALSTVADKVALIGAVSSYLLRIGVIHDAWDLNQHFKEVLDTLARLLAEQKGNTREAAVSDAWAKFCGGRAAIEAQHQALIARLSAP